jgi:hypothetical protein
MVSNTIKADDYRIKVRIQFNPNGFFKIFNMKSMTPQFLARDRMCGSTIKMFFMRCMNRIGPAIDFAASGRNPEITFIIFLLQVEVLQKVFSEL